MDYECLKEQYPDTISMDQLYQICHISKRKAHWLLENGVIPCRDSGKQTQRFQIQLEDVIRFLEQRAAGELEGILPRGTFTSRRRHIRVYLDSAALCNLMMERWDDAPDMLTSRQAESLCGYGKTTINQWIQKGLIQGLSYHGTNLLSKESLAVHLASHAGQDIAVKSELHIDLLRECQAEEQNRDMEFGSMSL